MSTPHEVRDRFLHPLVGHAARMEAHKAQLVEARRTLQQRATEQRDTTTHALEEAQAWLARHPDNHLIALRVENLLRERARLDAIVYRMTRPSDTEPRHDGGA